MKVLHLTASPFYGGPERQMLGLGQALAGRCRSVYASFPERGLCRPFLSKASELGFETFQLTKNFPQARAAVQELTRLLRRLKPDVLCCHNYKPDLLGWLAARRTSTPIIAVTRGWTDASLKVRLYDKLDSWSLRWMDAVVCVSEGMARKVRLTGVSRSRLTVIRNAIDIQRFAAPDPSRREELQRMFAAPRKYILGAAGRLSPEKGFTDLIRAMATVCQHLPEAGLVLFGSGPLHHDLAQQIEADGLRGKVVLAGFRDDLDRWIPVLDLFALPSLTEGLPNVALESFAAGVPVVATAVGGTPEVVDEGVSGFLVPAGDAAALACRIVEMLRNDAVRRTMGQRGRDRIRREFTFAAQADRYMELFEQLTRAWYRDRRPVLATG